MTQRRTLLHNALRRFHNKSNAVWPDTMLLHAVRAVPHPPPPHPIDGGLAPKHPHHTRRWQRGARQLETGNFENQQQGGPLPCPPSADLKPASCLQGAKRRQELHGPEKYNGPRAAVRLWRRSAEPTYRKNKAFDPWLRSTCHASV